MTIVIPTRMVDYWVQTDAVDGHAFTNGASRFVGDVAQPRRTRVVFDARLGDEQGSAVPLVNLLQHLPHRPVTGFRRLDRHGVSAGIHPLIVDVVVDPERPEILFPPA